MSETRALVTGGSRGIGAAIARALGRTGRHVIVNCRESVDAAQSVVSDIESVGGSAEVAVFDVGDSVATAAALTVLLSDPRPIEVLVNNAGVLRDALFPRMSLADWHLVTRTTLDGFFHVTQPLVMSMVRRRRGRIINISSVAGEIGNRGQVNYSAAKAGLIGATRALAKELAACRVTVNAIAPGLVETEMLAGTRADQLLSYVPMRRFGQPDEIAALVVYLASDSSEYITGQVIGINGGLA
jgi:3-oxoacyl-[acyl-carrier protein] reductase